MLSRLLLAAVMAVAASAAVAQDRSVTIFAASPLRYALDHVNSTMPTLRGVKTLTAFASGAELVREIQNGSPADVLFADLSTMDAVDKTWAAPKSRIDILGDRLVLVARQDSKLTTVTVGPGFDLATLAGNGRIAVTRPALPTIRAALESLGAWNAAEPKLAIVDDAAGASVVRGEATIAIVTDSEARVEQNVKVIGTLPTGSYPPIQYAVAAASAAKGDAPAYLAHLRSATAQVLFERYGFTYLLKAGP